MNALQEQMVSYILPPEAIDLPYLYKCLKQPTDEIKPLWSSADNEAKYYHIQIHAEEMYDNDCCSENADTYVCEICNSDVPQVFFREHNESETHLTLRRICENVLQRVSKQLSVNVRDKSASCDTFCCHLCNKVVKIQNRSQHEHSLQHAKALQRLKLLNNFYKTFLNIDDDEDSCTDDVANRNNLDDKINLRDSNNSYFSSNDRGVEYDSDDSFVSPSTSLIVNSPLKTNETDILNISNKSTTTNKQFEKISFEMYLKEVINKFRLSILPPQTEGEYIYVVTPSGSKLKVSREHFHSFVEVNNKTYCQICKCVPQDAGAHEFTETHVTNIFKTINEHFSREIDHVYSHCLVCNEVIVTQSDHHRINDNHRSLITQTNLPTPTPSPKHKVKIGPSKTLCTICNVSKDTNNFLLHRASKKHKKKENKLLRANNITKTSKDLFNCKLCMVWLNFNELFNHIQEKTHVSRNIECKKDETVAPVSVKVPGNSEFCDVCKVKVPKGGMKVHVSGRPHKIKSLSSVDTRNNNIIDIKNKSQIANNDAIIKNSSAPGSSGAKIADNSNVTINDYSEFFKSLGKNYVLCKVCDEQITNTDQNIKEHVMGISHIIYEMHSLRESHKYFTYMDDAKTMLKCKICGVDKPNTIGDIAEHIRSENHKKEFKELLIFHKISSGPLIYNCEPCCSLNLDPLSHINTHEHTDNFVEKYGNELDIHQLSIYFRNKTLNGDKATLYRELSKNILSSNQIVEVGNGLYHCNICNVNVLLEIEHAFKENHKLAKKNKIN